MEVIKRAKEEGYEVIKYFNKYEPDHTSYSFIILNPNNLNSNHLYLNSFKLIDVIQLNQKKAKEPLYKSSYS